MSRLTVSLDENARRFLQEALSKALRAEEEPDQWAFAVLNLSQAVELALKARLRGEHPVLLYRSVEKRTETVGLQQALSRLRDIGQIAFSKSDEAAINLAARWRNAIVHYQFDYTIAEVKSTLAVLIGFLAAFYKNHLEVDLRVILPERLWQEAVAIREFGADLYSRAKERILKEGIHQFSVDWCRRCGWNAFVTTATADDCYVCGYAPDRVECAICGEANLPDDCDLHEVAAGRFEEVCQDCYDRESRTDDWR